VQEAEGDEAAAAVGSALAGQLLGVPVLRAVISDRPENATRFFVLGKERTAPTGNDRTTLVFAAPDDNKKGALRRVLSLFEAHDVNLTRIESRPSRKRAWDYVFFADVLGHEDDANLRAALGKLRRTSKFVKVCGSYPVAAR
jgi:chorismate mutase/prephenate dehydratase